MLRVRSLEAGYGKLRVLRSVSLHVSPGEVVGIIGANGAGKTTLLNTIAGTVRSWSGDIHFDGVSLRSLAAHRVITRGLALVPEGRQVFAAMTVEENLLLGAYALFTSGRRNETHGQLDSVYRQFTVLKERRNQLAGTLSGGEQQMLAIGRALMSKPRCIMLDEPSMGLAPLVAKNIFETVVALRKTGVTILIVEQNSKAVLNIADRGYVMETGSIVLEGSAQDLLNNAEVQRAYLGKDYERIND